MIGFVFPCDFMNNKKPDDGYADEYNAFKNAGYHVYLINIDNLSSIKKIEIEDIDLIYRGWMLSEHNYELMNNKLNNKLLVNTEHYLKSHHLPGWYENIKEFTFESAITTEKDASQVFYELGWERAFMKDYVKSLKTGKGSIVDSVDDVQRALNDIYQFKGFVEKGIVFREVVEFDKSSETRFFVLNGKVFSDNVNEEMFNFASEVSQNHNEFFYTIDVIKTNDNQLKVIEIGDGQVSDTVGWNLNNFVQIFDSLKIKNKAKP